VIATNLGLRAEIQWQNYSFTFRGLNRGLRAQCLVTTDVAELPMVSALRKSMLQSPELYYANGRVFFIITSSSKLCISSRL